MKPFFGRDKGEIRVCKQGLQVVYMFKILISWQPFSTGRKKKKKRRRRGIRRKKDTLHRASNTHNFRNCKMILSSEKIHHQFNSYSRARSQDCYFQTNEIAVLFLKSMKRPMLMMSFCIIASICHLQELAAQSLRWQSCWTVQHKSKPFHGKLLQMMQIYAVY